MFCPLVPKKNDMRFESVDYEHSDSDAATFCPPSKTILRYSWSKFVR